MTLEDFNFLDEINQIDLIISSVCIGGRDSGIFKVLLFHVQNFYVEVFFNKQERYITKFVAFDGTDRLEPYLEKLNFAFN
ncbi:MAG: hypothetical protein H0V30_00200 [Chitinophagaceae bacterium]|jgi:hypothetical protein|nr:hypothetical protein [Chitinophagaceae bacterium]